ncbi:calcium/calmodulin-dependent protein kinase type II delta chain-like isoform X1 [Hippocampus comes]|uniref:calcium/calmodulin-dependent protein kinase type II delta chain-like isoform X1 n=1 Tax=Hippocampus comes TaxID=109280 RepID=UPI00094E04B0|nr:PREDICTED: calcium/calmodulin-dependent protein kinase type II delta chain-like isoform X1 [Hippocampus comes]
MLFHFLLLLLSLEGILSTEVTVQWAQNSSEPDAVRAHQQEIIEVTKKLLTAIVMADYDSYKEMSDPGLTSFEPESLGILVRSMEFHRFLLENAPALGFRHTIMIEPYVHMMGDDAACIAYVRLTQALGGDLAAIHTKVEETRIWHRRNGTWRHIHFHRSRPSTLHSK